jgi:uncharacterized protein (TIGR03083 family)
MATTTTGAGMTAMDHEAWMAASAHEYALLLDLLRSLDAADWRRPTDCTEWDVQAMVAHLCGAADGNARPAESFRQALVGRRRYRRDVLVDSINMVQIADRAGRTPAQLVDELEDAGRRGVATRTKLPSWLRSIVLPIGEPVGTKPLGYLMDRIYTRDQWMHRIDISRATDRPLVVTAEHDGLLVADLVDEWASIHGRPFELLLTGPAGLQRTSGTDGERIEIDAVEFARHAAGRERGTGLLATQVPF